MTFIRTAQDLNLEAVLALEPDLIIGRRLVGDDPTLYEQLSRIAPTVVPHDEMDAYWQQYTYDLAGLLGIPERAEEVVQDYEERVAHYRERARAVIGEESVNVAIVFPKSLWLYGPGYLVGDLYVPSRDGGWPYNTLGLNPSPEAVELLGSESFAQISFEILPQLTAEHLIVLYDGAGTPDELVELEATLQTFTDHPLWQRVRAVQEGNVYVVATDRPCCYYSTLEVLGQFDAALHAEAAD
jgi:ABC-type Fe3+-hydroxamate transport system substrate-binding protein